MAISKRSTLQLLSAGLLAPGMVAAKKKDEILIEQQRGDAGLPYEVLRFDKAALARDRGIKKAQYLDRVSGFPALLVQEATRWLGKNRRNARSEISDLLALYNLPFEQNKQPIPFCAAGISYVAAALYAKTDPRFAQPNTPGKLMQYLGDINHHHFGPSPSVRDMCNLAEGQRRWVDKGDKEKEPKPGWLVVFNFGNKYDHVGIIERVEGNRVHSIDFNTVAEGATGSERDGGAIARKVRQLATITGYIHTGRASLLV